MPSGGPKPSYNVRYTSVQKLLTHMNAMPVPIGSIACASTSVPVSNDQASTPFTLEMVAGMGVHFQADTPGFVGDGPTPAIARANALAKARRIDAWEAFSPILNEDNPTGAPVTVNSDGETLWYIAYVLQSAGSGNCFVGRVK